MWLGNCDYTKFCLGCQSRGSLLIRVAVLDLVVFFVTLHPLESLDGPHLCVPLETESPHPATQNTEMPQKCQNVTKVPQMCFTLGHQITQFGFQPCNNQRQHTLEGAAVLLDLPMSSNCQPSACQPQRLLSSTLCKQEQRHVAT